VHICVRVPTQNEQPGQHNGNRTSRIDIEDKQAEYIEQNRCFKLVGYVVGYLDDILWPDPIIQSSLLTVYLAGPDSAGLSDPKHDEHDQSQKNLRQDGPKNVAGVHCTALLCEPAIGESMPALRCSPRRRLTSRRTGGTSKSSPSPNPATPILTPPRIVTSLPSVCTIEPP